MAGERLKRERLTPLWFILPSFLLLFAMIIYPLAFSLYYSFQFWNLAVSEEPRGFVGFQNYINVLTNPYFHKALYVTFRLSMTAVVLELLLGLGIAILLNQAIRGISVFRALLIMPTALAPTIAGLLFRYMYYQGLGMGVLPFFFIVAGIGTPEQGILGSSSTALYGVMATDVWAWTPFFALALLAGLQSVPQDQIEAAKVDGASEIRIFRHITLPNLRKVASIIFIIFFMQEFNVYDIIWAMTWGGPGNETTTVSFLLYWQGLVYYNIGLASAMTWVIALTILIFVNVYFTIVFRGVRV